jgi:hypothetical protein
LLGLTQAFGLGQAKSGLASMLPQEAIEEYKKLYEERFSIKLSDEEAALRANNLVKLYTAVYGASLAQVSGTPNDQV